MLFETPITRLKEEYNDNRFYVKREDLLPFCFGGNKVRKAELFFGDLRSNNSDVVVTYGSSSSNHCRIIANMAALNNIKCYIISPEEGYEETYNSKMVGLFGASIVKTPLDCVADTIEKTMLDLKKRYTPYFIKGGGHGNLGTQAYVNAYEEILQYEKENNICFDYIFLASGTGTTQAGLIAGKIKNKNITQKIVGISIARKNPYGRQVIIDSLKEYFNSNINYESDVIFIDKYICEGYGEYNSDILGTIKDVLFFDGIALNATYTGKAFWGMKKYIEENGIKNKNILFLNTGGTPLFFDGLEALS
ncbi:MAG: pyridoxal-phosphate dependent enzyme [Clostridia bacterium]|nr:pyridoxal-phosphate dependent enzyme [Clostridia bacterium]